MSLVQQEIHEGEVIDWNWINSYGIAREESTGKEAFIHHSCCAPKTNYAEGFLDDDGKEVKVRGEGKVWFELFEPVWWLSTDPDNPNVATRVTHLDGGLLTTEEAKAALFEPLKKPAAIVDIDNELDENQQYRGPAVLTSTFSPLPAKLQVWRRSVNPCFISRPFIWQQL